MRLISFFLTLLLSLPLFAEQTVAHSYSFAIIVDSDTYNACKEEINGYKKSVEKQGLVVHILSDRWETPESVKSVLEKYYKQERLEGCVFIGDIPVTMIRRAQHFTSAFKMDETSPIFDSSVPSDRFYDDFDLKFDFISRDTTHRNFFYYNLLGNSPQTITCDIYSGRIKPIGKGEEGYSQIRNYLRKLIKEKEVDNSLDRVVSYTGHGSFSNSIDAWKDETITLKEQIPSAFNSADGIKFFLYNMYPFMKETLTSELRRDDLDLTLFHEHGTPDRQYITGEPPAKDIDQYFENAKRQARQYLRRAKRYGKTLEEAETQLRGYGIDERWWEGAFSPEMLAADSLYDLKTGIILQDVTEIKPNSRVTIFDACYNGDFREDDFIAARYIFSEGKAVVGIGNSVNVLQDKSSSDLMGMLALGYSVGEWCQLTNILESHIIGDPTFRFSSKNDFLKPNLHSESIGYWKFYLDDRFPADIRSLALHKLFLLKYDGMSDLLLERFRTSPYYMERLQCMHLLAFYFDKNYNELLKLSVDDPYEFIRRKGAFYMGKVGDESFIPYLINLYIDDYMSERVVFNVSFSVGHFKKGLFLNQLKDSIDNSDFIFDKEDFKNKAVKTLSTFENTMTSTIETISDPNKPARSKLFYMTNLKNNPYPHFAETLVAIMKNPNEDPSIREGVINVLGWYVRSYNRDFILKECISFLENGANLSDSMKDELQKTINCLTAYMR